LPPVSSSNERRETRKAKQIRHDALTRRGAQRYPMRASGANAAARASLRARERARAVTTPPRSERGCPRRAELTGRHFPAQAMLRLRPLPHAPSLPGDGCRRTTGGLRFGPPFCVTGAAGTDLGELFVLRLEHCHARG
jgi:hypothetical protein